MTAFNRFSGLGRRSEVIDALNESKWSFPLAMRALGVDRAELYRHIERGNLLLDDETIPGLEQVNARNAVRLAGKGVTLQSLIDEASAPAPEPTRGSKTDSTFNRVVKRSTPNWRKCFHHIVRKLKLGTSWGGAVSLYLVLLGKVQGKHVFTMSGLDSSRLREEAGLNPNTMVDAKRLLIHAGLIAVTNEDRNGSRIAVTLLDPDTMQPFPGESTTADGEGVIVKGMEMRLRSTNHDS